MRFLWLDTETTGLEPTNSAAFELGMILVDEGKTIAERCFFLNPLNDIIKFDESSKSCHGYSEDEIKTFSCESEQIPKVAQFFSEAVRLWKTDNSKTEKMIIAGYNVEFDIKHLSAELERNGYKMSDYFRMDLIADVFKQVKKAQKMRVLPMLENRKLGTVCKHLGIKLENAHDAMADIRATRELAVKLHTLGATLL